MSETANIQNNSMGEVGINQTLTDLREKLTNLHKLADDFKWLDSGLSELQTMIINFLEHIREGVALIQGSKIIWVNKAGCDMVGYSLDEIRKMELRDLFVPGERDKAQSLIKAMQQAGFPFERPLDWTLLRKDRTVRYIKSFGYIVNYQGRPAAEVFFYDSTPERKLLEALQLRSIILDSISEIVFLLDEKGNLLYVNRVGIGPRGFDEKDLIGKNVMDFIPNDIRRREEIRFNYFSEHQETLFECDYLDKNDSRKSIEVKIKKVRINKKNYLVGVAHDKVEQDK